MHIKIGDLDKRIQIWTFDKEKLYGEVIKTPKLLLECWAKTFNKSGTEVYQAQATWSNLITHFIIRYRKDIEIKTNMEIKFNDLTYDIQYVNNYNYSNEYLEIVGEVTY